MYNISVSIYRLKCSKAAGTVSLSALPTMYSTSGNKYQKIENCFNSRRINCTLFSIRLTLSTLSVLTERCFIGADISDQETRGRDWRVWKGRNRRGRVSRDLFFVLAYPEKQYDFTVPLSVALLN
jgi:hypothetical protein